MSEASEQQLAISTRKRRLIAFFIDHFIMTALMTLTIFLIFGTKILAEEDLGKITSSLLSVIIPGIVLYFLKDAFGGISIGKYIMGIMVRDADNPEEVPSFRRLVFRNLFIILWPIELIALAFNKDNMRFGDRSLKTVVVVNPNPPKSAPRLVALVVVGIVFFGFSFLFPKNTMKKSEAYNAAVEAIARDELILQETGGIKGYGKSPTGSITVHNGEGKAQLSITVLGHKKNLKVRASLIKAKNGDWELTEITR